MTKGTIAIVVGLLLSSVLTAWAQFQGAGEEGSVTTVSVAKNAVDDSWFSLTGKILRRVGGEQYLFEDKTGTMIVEIDHKDWRNMKVDPRMIVRISGEIDREWGTNEMEVEMIEVVDASDSTIDIGQLK